MKKILPICFASVAFLAQASFGQNATTTPVGAITISFAATGASPATTTKYISVPLQADAAFTGKPTAIGANTLSFTGVAWTLNQFGANPSAYVARVMTGQQAGRVLQVVSNTPDTLTLSIADRTNQTTDLNLSGFAVTSSDTVEIVPCDTLSSLFGDNSVGNPTIFTGSTSLFTSDTIGILDRSSGKWVAYFFNTSLNQWRKSGSATNFNSLAVYPDDAIAVIRRTNRTACQLTLTGRVPTVAPLIKAAPGSSYVTTFALPVDIVLSNITFSGAWTKANSLFTADTLGAFNESTGKFVPFFQKLDNSWRSSATSPDVSSTVFPAGSAVSILERTSNQTGANSFNKFPLPYSL